MRGESQHADMEVYYYADRVLKIEQKNGQLIMEVKEYGRRSGDTTGNNRGQQKEEEESQDATPN